jgi:dTDP-4-dehydrorhamnose reductase
VARERWLVTGASGQLGGHVLRRLAGDPLELDLLSLCGRRRINPGRGEVASADFSQPDHVTELVRGFRPTHILHIGGMTAVAECLQRPEDARRINADATRRLGELAAELHARLIYSSTDMVFDGEAAPYDESAVPRPLSVYGSSKLGGENALRGAPNTLIARLPLMYGVPVFERPSTFVNQLAALRRGEPIGLYTDEWRTPIWLTDAARAVIGLARGDLTGTIHVPGPERMTRFELIQRAAELLGTPANLTPVSRLSNPSAEPRPRDLSLSGERLAREAPQLRARPMSIEAFA